MDDLHDAASPKTMSFKDLLGFLGRGVGFAMALALLAGGAAYLLTGRESPVYQATASLLASPKSNSYGNSNVVVPSPVDPSVYQSVLLDGPVVRDALTAVEGKAPSEADVRSFRSQMTVSVNQKALSSVISIQVEARDPELAARAANEVASSLVVWDRARAQRSLQQSIDAIQRSIQTIQQQLKEPSISQDARDSLRSLLQRRTTELQAARSTAESAVYVGLLEPLAMATKPNAAIGPRTLLKTGVAMAFGLALGYLLLFLRWSLDTHPRGTDDMVALGAGPVMATFARRKRKVDWRVGEAANFLRANVLLSAAGRQLPSVVAITSPYSGQEKSGVALSLAESFARSGYATLLIDADLRQAGNAVGSHPPPTRLRAQLKDYLENPGTHIPALSVEIGGEHTFDFIASFKPAQYPAELLSASFGARLDGWRADYEVVVVDAPPLLPYADAMILAPYCDGVVVCASQRATTREQLVQALTLLRQADVRLLGTVLTEASPHQHQRAVAGRGADSFERLGSDPQRTRPKEGRRQGVGTRR
jgi:Mrp family chromosome partitioning ATPase